MNFYTVSMILVSALVTYLVRMIPMALLRKKIRSPFILDCLYYMPYAVLAAMTVPQIFYSAGDLLPSAVGAAVAVITAAANRSLTVVALSASLGAYLTSLIITLI